MKYGKALNEYREFVMEMFMDGNDYDGMYTAYQFEYPEDEAWCFGASVWEDGGEWVAELDEAYWADEWRATFPTMDEAMEWCASWAWCPEVGQGEEGERQP